MMMFRRPKPFTVYEDCAYHLVLCTQVSAVYNHGRWSRIRMRLHLWPDDYDVGGFSLKDGSFPRSCSVKHCAPVWMPPERVEDILNHRGKVE